MTPAVTAGQADGRTCLAVAGEGYRVLAGRTSSVGRTILAQWMRDLARSSGKTGSGGGPSNVAILPAATADALREACGASHGPSHAWGGNATPPAAFLIDLPPPVTRCKAA